MRKYTKEQLLQKYAGKYIDIYGVYDYSEQEWLFEVRGVKSKIWENYNLPEEAINGYK